MDDELYPTADRFRGDYAVSPNAPTILGIHSDLLYTAGGEIDDTFPVGYNVTMTVVKLNISLDPSIATLLRQRAEESDATISGYLSRLIREDHVRAQDELAREGYEALSMETRAFAESAVALASEVWEPWTDSPAARQKQATKGSRTSGRKAATR